MMNRKMNIKGDIFNGIECMDFLYTKNGKSIWKFKCHCGEYFNTVGSHIKNGYTKSCGCSHKSRVRKHLKWEDLDTVGFYVCDNYTTNKVHSNKSVDVICKNCENSNTITSRYLYKNGLNCSHCNDLTMSYGERLFKSLLDYKGIEYEQEYTHKDLPNRRFDFKTGNLFIEINGKQHYSKVEDKWNNYEKTKESDEEKYRFCKSKRYDLVFIDASVSDYNTLMRKFKEVLKLEEKIDKNKILNIFYSYNKKEKELNQDIIDSYIKGVTLKNISETYDVSIKKINNILNMNGIKRNRVKKKVAVICLNNMKEYDSIKEASKDVGLKNSGSLYASLNDRNKTAGKNEKGEKLKWIRKEDMDSLK